MELSRIRDIMDTIIRCMMRYSYCCGCYCYDNLIYCYVVKDNLTITRIFKLDWITEETKWMDILGAINYLVLDVNHLFFTHEKQHLSEE